MGEELLQMYIKEVAASLYAWDLADEGISNIADTLTERCSVNSIYLVGVMHFEKRPLTSLFYTHNKVRKYYQPENSRAYYKLDLNSFKNTKLKPMFSERDFLKDTDWLDVLTKEARRRGLKAGLELSHTIFDTDIAKQNHPEMLQRDVTERIIGEAGNVWLCPNHPDVHEYMRAMFYDSVKNHDIDFIQTCLLTFPQGYPVRAPWHFDTWMNVANPRLGALIGAANGGCFCESCRAKAKKFGFDWDLIMRDVTALFHVANATPYIYQESMMENHLTLGSNATDVLVLMEYPGLMEFLKFKVKCITELFKDIYKSVHEANPNIDFRYNNHVSQPEYTGISFKDIAPYLDSVRDCDYSEQTGAKDDFLHKRSSLLKIRRGIGFEKPILAALAVRPNATPELIRRSVKVVSEMGADGFSLGHYDCAHMEHLDAFKQGLQEAHIEII